MRRALALLAVAVGAAVAVIPRAGAATFTPPSPLDFGSVQVGASSPAATVTIQGSAFPGGFDVVSNVSLIPGSAFSIVSTTCNAVPPPTSCSVTMVFTPAGAGPASGTLSGTETNPATGASSPFSYSLTGAGTAPPPVLPEAPDARLLPLIAAALFGTSFLILRRRATTAATKGA